MKPAFILFSLLLIVGVVLIIIGNALQSAPLKPCEWYADFPSFRNADLSQQVTQYLERRYADGWNLVTTDPLRDGFIWKRGDCR